MLETVGKIGSVQKDYQNIKITTEKKRFPDTIPNPTPNPNHSPHPNPSPNPKKPVVIFSFW